MTKINRLELIFLIIGIFTSIMIGFLIVYSLLSLKNSISKAFSSDVPQKSANFDIEGYNKLEL